MLLRKLKPKAEGSSGCGAITAIAIDKDKNSQHALRWAVENIIPADSPHCVLLHVKHKSRETKEEEEDQKEAYRFFIPFRGFCGRKGIRAKEVLLHHHDISSAIAKYLADDCIANVVVGASAHNSLLKKFMHTDLAANLFKKAPETCAVFVISKGKLITSRSANHPRTPRSPHAQKGRAVHFGETGRTSSMRSRELVQSAQHDRPRSSPSQSDQSNNSPSANSQWEIGCDFSRFDSMASTETSYSILEYSTTYGSSLTSLPSMSISEMDDMQDSSLEHQNQSLEREIRRLRLQLQAVNSALGREAMTATENALDLREKREAETRKLEEARQEAETPRAPSVVELQKSEAAIQAAEMAQRLAEMESQKKKLIEMQAKLEEQQKTSADYRLSENRVSYRRYSIKEIEDATVCFSDALKIGEGGYGPVYKAVLDHTAVAIKILKSDVSQGLRQFHQEIEVLSCIRHPNMVILLGACPEYGCLVYEYMENGTLEDRLFCKDDSPPLTWRSRFRIAAEIATGLLFLHQAKPEPLVHRDLKPANILLDRHFVSKISDVGLARLVPSFVAENISQYHMTAAAGTTWYLITRNLDCHKIEPIIDVHLPLASATGTFCYIDPEYQQTGMLGVKSDLYSFGVVLLQIITARPPIGLSHKVEQAIDNTSFREILDPNIQDWPIKETLALAKMALQCCELRKKDRPDLASGLLPLLNRLRDLALEDHEPDSDRTLHST